MKPLVPSPDRIAMDGLSFDAISEAAGLAATYADMAARFASVNDTRGVNYALRCASAAMLTATQVAEMLSRPAGRRGGA